MKAITSSLKSYIETTILPRYSDPAIDKAHDLSHINTVIDNSLEIAKEHEVNIDMVYTIAAYHDVGIAKGRKDHHITSGEILYADKALAQWFTPDELITMKEAIEDHRASSSHPPRSLYGRIISEGDRDISPDTILYRTMLYGYKLDPTLSFDEQFDRTISHVEDKYGENGYLTLWLETSKNKEGLRVIRKLLTDRAAMRERTLQLWKANGYEV